jgi:hypothetical protein
MTPQTFGSSGIAVDPTAGSRRVREPPIADTTNGAGLLR